MKILFLSKKNDAHCKKALNFCKSLFDVEIFLGLPDEVEKPELLYWNGDYIISYLSPWIVPDILLKKAKIAAINFHPAPPEYPGTGCINFALYEGSPEYGTTCHYMQPSVDSGKIIAVKRFNTYPHDTVESLLDRTYDYQLTLFYEIMEYLYQNQTLPVANSSWSRKPHTRKELDKLATLTLDLDVNEITKRIRATTFKDWKPQINIGGSLFKLEK